MRFRSSGCSDSACRRMFPLESNTKMRNLSFRLFEDAANNKPRSCMLLLMVTRKNAALPIFTEPRVGAPGGAAGSSTIDGFWYLTEEVGILRRECLAPPNAICCVRDA